MLILESDDTNMFLSISLFIIILFAVSGVADSNSHDAHATNNGYETNPISDATLHRNTRPSNRVLITRYESIADKIRSSMLNQGTRHFDIEVEDSDDNDSSSSSTFRSQLLHLNTMTPSITPATIFHFNPSRNFNPDSVKDMVQDMAVLASDPSEVVGDEFTVMSVDMKSGDVMGMQRGKRGETRQISLGPVSAGDESTSTAPQRSILRVRTVEHSDRNFTCGVDHTDDEHVHRELEHMDHHHHDHHHDHEHRDHNHHEHHHHHEQKRSLSDSIAGNYHTFNPFKLFNSEHHAQSQTPNSRLRAAPFTSPGATSDPTLPSTAADNVHPGFTIKVIIAIDAKLIKLQGGKRQAIKYIGFLIDSANAIYTRELGVHLHVAKVEETNIFHGENKLREGLATMRKHYDGTFGPEGLMPENEGIDLMHGLLGDDLGGGIAFIDTICDSKWGVGFSSGLRGTMKHLDDDAMHDAFMVAHEIGHSLGSGHTFDKYDPPVDTCGIECPTELPIDNSATLMSYCNFCDGGLNNIALTLGGKYKGYGDKFDLNSWTANPQLESSSISEDAHRVSHKVWTTLENKGECIEKEVATPPPTVSPTGSPPTTSPTDSPTTVSPTTSPTTKDPTSSPTKSPTHFPEHPNDGRIWAQPDVHCMEDGSCVSAPGIMFDIGLPQRSDPRRRSGVSAAKDTYPYGVIIESMQFEHIHRNVTVDLYTTDGSSQGSEQLSKQWNKVGSVRVGEADTFTEIELDVPITISPGSRQGFYFVAPGTEKFFIVGITSARSSSSPDANGVSFRYGSVIFDTFGANVTGFDPTIQAGFTVAEPPTMSPTTRSPTDEPTSGPTSFPTKNPTSEPTFKPTTKSPTSSPTIDYGPFEIKPDHLCDDDCNKVSGFMFSVKHTYRTDRKIVINGLNFEHLSPKNDRKVHLYMTTTKGSHEGRESDSTQWTKVATVKVPKEKFHFMNIVLKTPITLTTGETVGFYITTTENILLVGKNLRKNDDPTDDNRVQLFCGSAIMNGKFGDPTNGYSWNGEVDYSTATIQHTLPLAAAAGVSPGTRGYQYQEEEIHFLEFWNERRGYMPANIDGNNGHHQ